MDPEEIRECRKCGTALSAAARRCASCGTPVAAGHPAGSESAERPRREKQRLADKASADSFPASDPPAYQARRGRG